MQNNYNKILNKKQRLRNTVLCSMLISRKDLVAQTGLNYRSIIMYAEELKQQGLIDEKILPSPAGGRPSVHYINRSDRLYCVGVLLYGNAITVVAAGINSDIFHTIKIELSPQKNVSDLIRHIFRSLEHLRQKFPTRILAGIELCRYIYCHNSKFHNGMAELYLELRRQYRTLEIHLNSNNDLILLHLFRNFGLSGRAILLSPGAELSISMVEDDSIAEMDHYSRQFQHYQLSAISPERCYCGKNSCADSLLRQSAQLERYNRLIQKKRQYPNIAEGMNHLQMQAHAGDVYARQLLSENGRLYPE